MTCPRQSACRRRGAVTGERKRVETLALLLAASVEEFAGTLTLTALSPVGVTSNEQLASLSVKSLSDPLPMETSLAVNPVTDSVNLTVTGIDDALLGSSSVCKTLCPQAYSSGGLVRMRLIRACSQMLARTRG